MHGPTICVNQPVLPRGLKNLPSLMPAVCREDSHIDRAVRAVMHTVGHNPVATSDESRESVLEPRGNTHHECPLRGILAERWGEYQACDRF
jgi:hypothetical protein|uniref:Uncharacterized protein n=1 Tax=uncultured haloarchaeon TaxID=160804 RepID=A0A0K1YBQ7_9EURY|nr:hypothetical protein [uncultured haloarchaeon]